MSRIDTGRYKPSAENLNKLEYAGQKTAREVFNELQYKLKAEGYLPDECFLLNSRLDESGALFPDNADIMCNVNWGGNEGIYLDIMLRSRDEKGELQYISFATGKTLGESDSDLDRMYLIASACTKAFHSPGVHNRFIAKDKENGGEQARESISCAPAVLHLNEREKKIVTESLIETRNRYKAENRPLEEIEQLLRRIIGTITEYIKAVGERPQNLDYGDIASLAIIDGNIDGFKEALPHVPHLYGNLLNEAVGRPDEYGSKMTNEILSVSRHNLSNDIYKRACASAIQNGDTGNVLMLMKNAGKCVSGLDKEFYGDILLQSLSSRDKSMPKAIISGMTADQVKDADPHLLKLALMEKSYDVAKELIFKGIDVLTLPETNEVISFGSMFSVNKETFRAKTVSAMEQFVKEAESQYNIYLEGDVQKHIETAIACFDQWNELPMSYTALEDYLEIIMNDVDMLDKGVMTPEQLASDLQNKISLSLME